MIEPEWMKFESTGSVTDYLRFKGQLTETDAAIRRAQEEKGRSVTEDGTDHSADRHGVIGSSGGRI